MKRNRIKTAALLLTAALLCTVLPVPAQAAVTFQDVSASAWYRSAVYDLVEKGILSGTGEGKFSPSDNLTRAAFVAMLAQTALTPDELEEYRFKGDFKDVSKDYWGNRFVNWASENGVVSGYKDNTFRPNNPVTRQEMAVMVINFANVTCRRVVPVNEEIAFTDSKDIAKYAVSGVKTCQMAGVISGYKDGTFQPKGLATRAEAAALYSNFLKKCVQSDKYKIYRKRINGTAVRAVEFDPKDYTADLVLGRDLVDGAESPGSMVSRSGAVFAINAAFFNMSNYLPVGTMIKENRVITVNNMFAPEVPAFTEDPAGKYSIQSFAVRHSVRYTDLEGEEVEMDRIGFNTWPTSKTDATRILFTRDWGHSLCFTAKDAVTLDENGTVLAVDHDMDAPIPETGYVLAQRARRGAEEPFFDNVQVGDVLEVVREYENASSQDIILSVASGPRLVKDGEVYGGADTYAAEGFGGSSFTAGYSLRMCIGIKADGKIIMASAYSTLRDLSETLIEMGCTDAINLDGGGSGNLYADGFWLRGPQERSLNNMLVFKPKTSE